MIPHIGVHILKRPLDITIALIALLVVSPLLFLIALSVKLGDGGDIFFKQRRLGFELREFTMVKFRTMEPEAESKGTGLFSYAEDPRITRVGRYLRASSLDELPQLWNVLRGDMSIVGPRPPVTYELGDLGNLGSEYGPRFLVRPGITGLAQISGRNDLCWSEKVKLDTQYVNLYAKWGIWIDILIMLKTIWVVVLMKDVVEKDPNR